METTTTSQIAPTNNGFWDILDNGLDVIQRGIDIYTDTVKKQATTSALTTPAGFEFFKTGIGLITLMGFILVLVYLTIK